MQPGEYAMSDGAVQQVLPEATPELGACNAPHSKTGLCGCPKFIPGKERRGWVPCINTRPSGEPCGHTETNHKTRESSADRKRKQ